MHFRKPEEKKDASREAMPSIGQLREWASNDVTKWVLKSLAQRFPDYRQELPIKSADHAYRVNYRIGNSEVMEAIARLIEHGEI